MIRLWYLRFRSALALAPVPPQHRHTSRTESLPTGIRPRFFNQKIEQKEPEKKMPSTAAKAIKRSAKDAYLRSHHRSAQRALRRTQGTVSMAFKSLCFSDGFLM